MKIKVLFLAANPESTVRLKLDEEIRAITQRIRAAEHRDLIEVVQEHAVRPDDLQDALLRHKPHMVHFSGHGSDRDELLLVDDSGRAKPVSKNALVNLFRILRDNVKVVVLNACFSRPQAEGIVTHIPCAVGMSQAVGDTAAIKFAAAFYRALAFGRSVQDAFDLGVNSLMLEDIPEEHAPALLTQIGVDASSIVVVNPSSQIDQTPSPSVRKTASAVTPPLRILSSRAMEVFISYAHQDKRWLKDRLLPHLSLLQRQGVITTWQDADISPGTDWRAQIEARLNSAGIILLLISADFLASDFCYDEEMQWAMERHEAGSARVIPVFLRPCDWKGAPFGKLHGVPSDARPVSRWPDKDEAFTQIAQAIRKAAEELAANPPHPPRQWPR